MAIWFGIFVLLPEGAGVNWFGISVCAAALIALVRWNVDVLWIVAGGSLLGILWNGIPM